MGDRFYKQRVGIPQGSVLSTILCGFFYGNMEASRKFKFTENLANVRNIHYHRFMSLTYF
jgi:telomerase reverse transcriptase